MRPIVRLMLISFALTAGAFTTACDTLDNLEFWDAKKKLAGDRKPVFPEGVPGVSQGIPPELMRGYQEPQTEANAAPGGEPTATGSTGADKKAEPAAKPKPKPKPVAQKKPPPPPEQAEAPAPQPQPQSSGAAAKPWPSAQPQTQPQAAWPSAPSSGRFER